MSTLITGGLLVTAGDAYLADVLIENGKVALVGRDLDAQATSSSRPLYKAAALNQLMP